MSGFIVSGHVSAANSELAAVQTALEAYNSENPGVTTYLTETPSGDFLSNYLSNPPLGTYVFTESSGNILQLSSAAYTGLSWNGTQFAR